jgi:hypothetical protein
MQLVQPPPPPVCIRLHVIQVDRLPHYELLAVVRVVIHVELAAGDIVAVIELMLLLMLVVQVLLLLGVAVQVESKGLNPVSPLDRFKG